MGIRNYLCRNFGWFCPPKPEPEPPSVIRRVEFDHNPFGLHAAGGGERLAAEAGCGWIREIVHWGQVEPSPGDYNWTDIDKYDNGIPVELIATLKPSHREAIDLDYDLLRQQYPERPWQFWEGMPKDVDRWKAFVREIVSRYNGWSSATPRRVNYWQIGNEPRWQWQSPLSLYPEFVRETTKAIRQANSNAKIILGGMTEGLKLAEQGTAEHLRQFGEFVVAVEEHVDYFDFHQYSRDPWSIETEAKFYRGRGMA